ncbi:MAG TPA: translocation/assembly module TamB domain-containing protein, partial [Candidatus Baltobacteraceae bacterium]|nr:translocation/assembly module TamB domain-containing protein [Candidatus Baltobacteraceae bacterium]
MPTRAIRWLSWAFLAILSLAGFFFALSLVIRSYAPVLTREGLQQALTGALDRPVQIERVSLRPWLGRITLRNVAVGPDEDGGPDPAFRVGKTEIQVSITSVWKRRLVVSGELSDVHFDLLATPKPKKPVRFEIPDSFRLGPIEVEVGSVRVHAGSGTFRDPREDVQVTVGGLEGSAHPLRRGLDTTVNVGSVAVEHAGRRVVVTDVTGSGWLGQELLTIRSVFARWMGHRLTAGGDMKHPFGHTLLALNVSGDLDIAAAAKIAQSPLPLTGLAHLEGTLQGPPAALEAAGRITAPRFVAGPVDAQRLDARVRWTAGTLDVSDLSAQVFGGSLKGKATVVPAHLERSRFEANLMGAAVVRLAVVLPQPLGTGEVDLQATLDGDPRHWQSLEGDLRLSARQFMPPGDWSKLGLGTLQAAGRLQRGTLQITQGLGDWPGLQVEVTGPLASTGPLGMHVRLEAELATLGPLLNLSHVAGRTRVVGEVQGSWEAPGATARIEVPTLTIDAVALDHVASTLVLSGQTVRVESLSAQLKHSQATAAGAISWTGPVGELGQHYRDRITVRADVSAPTIRWEDLAQWLPPAGQGTGPFSVTGRIEGTLASWRATGTVQAGRVTPLDQPSVQQLAARFTLNAHGIELPSIQAQVLGASLHGAGSWDWNRTGQATLDVAGLDFTRVPNLPTSVGLRGTGAVHVEVNYRSGAWDGSGSAHLQDVVARDFRFGAGSIQANVRANQVQAHLAFPEARLTADAQGPISGAAPIRITAEAKHWALGPLLRALGEPIDVPVDGVLTARLVFDVPVTQPTNSTGTITLDPARIILGEEEWTNPSPLILRWDGAALLLEHIELASRLGRFTAKGRAEPHGHVDIEVNGGVPLAILPIWVPEIREASGLIALTARVTGTTDAPRLNGEATVRNGLLQFRDRPETLRDIEARIVMAPEGMRLVEATATLGRGRVQAAGTLTLQGTQLGAYRFTLQGQNVSITPTEGMQTTWNVNLELLGRGTTPILRGEAHLVRGVISGKFSLVSLLLSRTPGKVESKAAIPLRVLLFLDNNLRVSLNIARLSVGGRLSLEGTTAAPVLLGTVQGEEGGRIEFGGQRWTVQSAAVRFIDPRGIEPLIDVSARATVQNYDVMLRLAGRLDELSVHLSSSPPLAQDKLLLLFALGTTGEAAGQAGGALAGAVGRMVAEDLFGEAVGTSWTPDVSLQKLTGNQQVVQVGKQVTEDIRVLYAQTISGPTTRLIRVEYQIIGPLFLSAEQNFQGGFGGEVIVR